MGPAIGLTVVALAASLTAIKNSMQMQFHLSIHVCQLQGKENGARGAQDKGICIGREE